jgi:type II secretory pathway pseudopilin PulG
MGKIKKRAGFTLIEVIVALGIFMIVVLALLSSYYSYYRNVQNERYKTIGENLAQLQLEDIQNLPVSLLSIIVGENSDDGKGYYLYPYEENPSDPINNWTIDNYIDIYGTTKDSDKGEYIFDSGEIDSTFRIYRLDDVSDLDSANVPGIVVESTDQDVPYNIVLYHNIYPGYTKQIVIEDLTSGVSEYGKKIFKISVTVFWKENGVTKQITVEGFKNDIS